MNNQFFPPTEAELDEKIESVQREMKLARVKSIYDQLHDKLKELREQKRQLIIKNNAL